MTTKSYKRINVVLFIYEIYKDSFFILSLISSILSYKIQEILGYLYYPLIGFDISSFEFFKTSCCVEVVLFITSCVFSGRMVKSGLEEKFQNYIIFFTLLSFFSTGFYLMIMTVGMF